MIYFTCLFFATWATAQADGQSLKAEVSSLRSGRDFENSDRRLDHGLIGGYHPVNVVTDYAAIDRDQAAMEDQLERESDEGFENAKAIYEQGGYSKPYAIVTLDRSPDTYVLKSTIFTGTDSSGTAVIGKSYETQQRNIVQLRYEASDGLGGVYPECNVGALTTIGAEVTYRCFRESGTLETTISGQLQTFNYNYNMLTENKNARTIQDFSRLVKSDMITCAKCPYADVKYAADYYGSPYYSNEWILAAFASKATSYERGNADFSDYGHVGRAESIRIGAVAMNIFMYVLREFEDAVGDCESGSSEGVENWDQGVALYTGSLEGAGGSPGGKLLHQMADEHCAIFRTCNKDGVSRVNHDLLALFELGQEQLVKFDCIAAKQTKDKIANLMYIPLIQGTLHAAYRLEFLEGYQREEAQGAAYAAAVLPRVHFENEDAAKIIYKNMRVGAASTSHREVKEAFQSIYKDININCGDVGGMWDKAAGIYYKGGNPCNESRRQLTGIILGGVFGSIGLGLIGTFFYYRLRSQIEY